MLFHLIHGRLTALAVLAGLCLALAGIKASANELQVLFLGDDGPHRPRERFEQLEPVLRQRAIDLTYTSDVTDLNAETLARYDVLLLYANIDRIEPDQERALLDYVAAGGGFVPLHCASYCFRNSDAVISLIGAQFQRHGWEPMRDTIVKADHPINRNYGGFESLDETYVHHLHNERARVVLAYRVNGSEREPWTWVRWHGKGRVFYTAWGHDHHTWSKPGFHNLVERGIRWAAGTDPAAAGPYVAEAAFETPKMTELPAESAPFEYVEVGAKIPNYIPSEKWGTQGEPYTRMQKPLPPAESMRRMVVPEGFRVELFAAEPEIVKPIAMTWDERGRLWLAETVDYPNELSPDNRGRDRIRICEDTTGDGRADRFTVFAENLSIPTSIAFAHGDVIVHSGTETLFLKDTDGDDRADERRVLFGTWEMDDTHGGPSNMQYGLDNWIWGMQGYNNRTAIRIGDRTIGIRQGFHRFRADGSDIEFIRSTSNNTWGFGMSEEGIIFGSTANGHPSIYMPIPNRYYERVRGWTPQLTLYTIADSNQFDAITDKVRQVDHHGGYTAGSGHSLYTARAYPRQWWNRTAFVCEPTGHLVGAFVLSPDGAGFRATSPCNLLASDDEWCAPIMAEVGPDGHVWVLDWYNYIVQHNPTPEGFQTGRGNAYETDLRDKRHGRIYRIVYSDAPKARPLDLSKATAAELVAALKNDNLLWRRHAQRLLVERGQRDVVPQLVELVLDPLTDEIGLNVGTIHALWTLHGLGAIGPDVESTAAAHAALRHRSPGVRRNALQVLPATSETVTAILDNQLLLDMEPQVRLAALLALADGPPDNAAATAIADLLLRPENAADRWIADAAIIAAAKQGMPFLKALVEVRQPNEKLPQVAQIVAEHVARSGGTDGVSEMIVSLGSADLGMAAAIVAGLAAGWPADRPIALNDEQTAAISALLEKLPLAARGALVQLATRWGSRAVEDQVATLVGQMAERVGDQSADSDERIAAARKLVSLAPHSDSVVEALLELLTPQMPPDVARGVLTALELSQNESTGELVVEHLTAQSLTVRSAGIEVLLKREGLTAALLDGLERGDLQLNELNLSQKRMLAEHPVRALRERAQRILASGGAIPSPDRQEVIDAMAGVAQETGDAATGKAVYTQHCAKCHVHSGEGTAVGPELTGIAVHPKSELLIHILDPSRSVEGNYRQYMVQRDDGRVLAGMVASESATAIELIDAEGKRQAVLREEIEALTAWNKSLMPEGFEHQLKRHELVDLLEFLATPGKYLPLDLRRVATVSSVQPMFFQSSDGYDRLVLEDWSARMFDEVPFRLVDPQEGRAANVVLLHGPHGDIAPTMPRSVELPVGSPARAIHLLSGVSGWGFPVGEKGSVSLVVRFHYADGQAEDHPLRNGIHFADYIRRIDVPESQFAFSLRNQQMRYLKITPQRQDTIERIELLKGEDNSAPIVMAVTIETH